MENPITIREAVTEKEISRFWEQLYQYFKRDIFAGKPIEDLSYFLGSEYHDQMMKLHGRQQDRCFFLFFEQDGQDIGFAMPVIYTMEDGKCFIMEFSVYQEHRGKGIGRECARVLLDWAGENGTLYAELNYGCDERRERFWRSVGFIQNGSDEWGDPLMILPPAEDVPITIEMLSDPEDWQLRKLENGYLTEIGEDPLTEEKQEQLSQAIRDGRITFFVAKRGYRTVGMCSIVKCFSTFACSETGFFEDFYIEPIFRRKGIARLLVQAVQNWSRENGLASLTVTCAPCDEEMYKSIGFDARLGTTFAYII